MAMVKFKSVAASGQGSAQQISSGQQHPPISPVVSPGIVQLQLCETTTKFPWASWTRLHALLAAVGEGIQL
jgi:hypothetical protein